MRGVAGRGGGWGGGIKSAFWLLARSLALVVNGCFGVSRPKRAEDSRRRRWEGGCKKGGDGRCVCVCVWGGRAFVPTRELIFFFTIAVVVGWPACGGCGSMFPTRCCCCCGACCCGVKLACMNVGWQLKTAAAAVAEQRRRR